MVWVRFAFECLRSLLSSFSLQCCELAGYSIPKGYMVAYISRCANRDAAVFSDPDQFKPERWRNE